MASETHTPNLYWRKKYLQICPLSNPVPLHLKTETPPLRHINYDPTNKTKDIAYLVRLASKKNKRTFFHNAQESRPSARLSSFFPSLNRGLNNEKYRLQKSFIHFYVGGRQFKRTVVKARAGLLFHLPENWILLHKLSASPSTWVPKQTFYRPHTRPNH